MLGSEKNLKKTKKTSRNYNGKNYKVDFIIQITQKQKIVSIRF